MTSRLVLQTKSEACSRQEAVAEPVMNSADMAADAPLAGSAPQRPERRRPRFGWTSALIVPLVVAIAWELVARNKLLSSSLFPTLSGVVSIWLDWIAAVNGKALVYSGTWIEHVGASAQRVLLGFVLGSLAGLTLGVLTGWSKFCRTLLDPLVQWLRPIPVTAWGPLSIIWFGIGGAPAVGLVFIGAFFPTYVNSMHGVMQVEDKLVRAARMLGAQRRQLLVRVVLPAALPTITTGMRVGLGFSWMCVIVSEMLAVKSGLGYVLWDSYYFSNLDMVVAAMASIGLLGFVSDKVFRALTRPYLRWADQGDRK
jgi:NitT/TauT family transport system permease protein